MENDYDSDGNNTVPCPVCLDVFCPSKEGGKCPREDEFARDMEMLEWFDGLPLSVRAKKYTESLKKGLLSILSRACSAAEKQGYMRAMTEIKSLESALLSMYEQYCGEHGHSFMSAGEEASVVLEQRGIAGFDEAGRLLSIKDESQAHDAISKLKEKIESSHEL